MSRSASEGLWTCFYLWLRLALLIVSRIGLTGLGRIGKKSNGTMETARYPFVLVSVLPYDKYISSLTIKYNKIKQITFKQ